MPSFVVHNIAGNSLIKKISLNEKYHKQFFAGNLLPDSKNIVIDSNLSEMEKRHCVQSEKEITHFRTNLEEILEYPNIDLFLQKYEEECKSNIVSLAYFFHLYTDYYYFKNFLPKQITFLDKDNNPTNNKKDSLYVHINKVNQTISKQQFWSKQENNGLYQEYSRLNCYLIKKYPIPFLCDDMLDYLKNNIIETNIKEVNPSNDIKVFEKLKILLDEVSSIEDSKLLVFNELDIDLFINEVVETFINKYNYILKNFI